MDKSVNESVTNQSFRSPPRRRRSTFFERRETIVPQPLSENIDPNPIACQRDPGCDDKHDVELSRYFEKLQKEKEEWKKEVNNRRNKYHDLRQQYQLSAKAPSRSLIPFSALTNDDINFMKGKPNISKLIESQVKLHKSVKETRALYQRANELDDVILKHSEDNIQKITEYILENSTIEPN